MAYTHVTSIKIVNSQMFVNNKQFKNNIDISSTLVFEHHLIEWGYDPWCFADEVYIIKTKLKCKYSHTFFKNFGY